VRGSPVALSAALVSSSEDYGQRSAGSSYSVVTDEGAPSKAEWSGLTHADAMKLAEKLRGQGMIACVMHVVGTRGYEVDRYPAR
jgi:hypothetical protein